MCVCVFVCVGMENKEELWEVTAIGLNLFEQMERAYCTLSNLQSANGQNI